MATWDYSADLVTAQEMIAETGRLVSLQAFNTELADPSDPLAGPGAPPAPVMGVPATFVYPSGLVNLGASSVIAGLFAGCEQIAMVAGDGVNDFAQFDTLNDFDGSVWKIERVETLKPGAIAILYYIGIKRP